MEKFRKVREGEYLLVSGEAAVGRAYKRSDGEFDWFLERQPEHGGPRAGIAKNLPHARRMMIEAWAPVVKKVVE